MSLANISRANYSEPNITNDAGLRYLVAVSCVKRLLAVTQPKKSPPPQDTSTTTINNKQQQRRTSSSSATSSSLSTVTSQTTFNEPQQPQAQATTSGSSMSLLTRERSSTFISKLLVLENEIHDAIDESCLLARHKQRQSEALNFAKTAQLKLQNVMAFLEKATQTKSRSKSSNKQQIINLPQFSTIINVTVSALSIAINFNLALQLKNNNLLEESFQVYTNLLQSKSTAASNNSEPINSSTISTLVKNERLSRLGINMGNLCVQMGDQQRALKYYRLTYDRLSTISNNLRTKTMHNICVITCRLRLSTRANFSDDTSNVVNEKLHATTAASVDNLLTNLVNDNLTNIQVSKQQSLRKVAFNANYYTFARQLLACKYLRGSNIYTCIEVFEDTCHISLRGDHFRQLDQSSTKYHTVDILDMVIANRLADDFDSLLMACKLILELICQNKQLSDPMSLKSRLFKALQANSRLSMLLLELKLDCAWCLAECQLYDVASKLIDNINKETLLPSNKRDSFTKVIEKDKENDIQNSQINIKKSENLLISQSFAVKLSTIYIIQNKLEEGLNLAQQALININTNEAHNNIVTYLMSKGKLEDAMRYLDSLADSKLIECKLNKVLCLRQILELEERSDFDNYNYIQELKDTDIYVHEYDDDDEYGELDDHEIVENPILSSKNLFPYKKMELLLKVHKARVALSNEEQRIKSSQRASSTQLKPLQLLMSLLTTTMKTPTTNTMTQAEIEDIGPEVVLKLCEQLDKVGDHDKSAFYATKANKLYPWHLEICKKLVAHATKNSNYPFSLNILKYCVTCRRDQIIWLHLLAESYQRCGQYIEAIQTYKIAVRRFPRDTTSLNALIQLSKEIGQKSQLYEYKLAKLTSSKSNIAL